MKIRVVLLSASGYWLSGKACKFTKNIFEIFPWESKIRVDALGLSPELCGKFEVWKG